MADDPANLLALQEADIEILKARTRLKELPEKEQILAVRTKIKEVSALLAKAAELTRRLEADLKARQDEQAMITDKLSAEQTKVMQTSDHRQITALTREMDGLKRRADKLEMESMQLLERIEKATAQRRTIEGHLSKLTEQDAVLVAAYQAAGARINTEVTALMAERARLAASVDASLLSRYESVRESKGGVAVGRLDGTSCTACRMDLPSERVRELRDGPDVGVCPQCRRLIVVRRAEDV